MNVELCSKSNPNTKKENLNAKEFLPAIVLDRLRKLGAGVAGVLAINSGYFEGC